MPSYIVFQRVDPEGDQDAYRDVGRVRDESRKAARAKWAKATPDHGEFYLVPGDGFLAQRPGRGEA